MLKLYKYIISCPKQFFLERLNYKFVLMDRIQQRSILQNKIENIASTDIEVLIKEVYSYQLKYNAIYKRFVDLSRGPNFRFEHSSNAPFMPIQFFKNHEIKSGDWDTEKIYRSSATTGSIRSQHFVQDEGFYLKLAAKGFESFYGALEEYTILALLPGYLERQDSSLVAMVQYFIERSGQQGGFFLDNLESLVATVKSLQSLGKKVLLIGVSHALLELAKHQVNLTGVMLMETGGMKGKGKEMTKEVFYEQLKINFKIDTIHSEYGMTELQSQAYSLGQAKYKTTPTLIPVLTEMTDPFCVKQDQSTGVLNFIDLVNLDSCSFIATEDLARMNLDGTFELMGRLDHSEIRGCNLMLSDLG